MQYETQAITLQRCIMHSQPKIKSPTSCSGVIRNRRWQSLWQAHRRPCQSTVIHKSRKSSRFSVQYETQALTLQRCIMYSQPKIKSPTSCSGVIRNRRWQSPWQAHRGRCQSTVIPKSRKSSRFSVQYETQALTLHRCIMYSQPNITK